MKIMIGFWYGLGFAIINLLEAFVMMLCLGIWSPNWVIVYAKWYSFRKISKMKKVGI